MRALIITTEDVVLLEAFVRREVVIENEEDPRGLFPVFERREAVGGKAECDIAVIREISMGQPSVFNNNMLSEEFKIMEPIENICCPPGYAGPLVFISTVQETSGVGAIRPQCTETRDKGHIGERSPHSTRH